MNMVLIWRVEISYCRVSSCEPEMEDRLSISQGNAEPFPNNSNTNNTRDL